MSKVEVPDPREAVLPQFLRIIILAKRGIGPRNSNEMYEKSSAVVRRLFGRPMTLGEYTKFEAWAYPRLGFVRECVDNVLAWRKSESEARERKRERWEDAIATAKKELPDWCDTMQEIELQANKILATSAA